MVQQRNVETRSVQRRNIGTAVDTGQTQVPVTLDLRTSLSSNGAKLNGAHATKVVDDKNWVIILVKLDERALWVILTQEKLEHFLNKILTGWLVFNVLSTGLVVDTHTDFHSRLTQSATLFRVSRAAWHMAVVKRGTHCHKVLNHGAAKVCNLLHIITFLRSGTENLGSERSAGQSAATDKATLTTTHRHIITDIDHLNVTALTFTVESRTSLLRGQTKVEAVTSVVEYDCHNTLVCGSKVYTTADLLRAGRSKHITTHSHSDKTAANEAGESGLMTGTATCQNGYLVARVRSIVENLVMGKETEIGVRRGHAEACLLNETGGIVKNVLGRHGRLVEVPARYTVHGLYASFCSRDIRRDFPAPGPLLSTIGPTHRTPVNGGALLEPIQDRVYLLVPSHSRTESAKDTMQT